MAQIHNTREKEAVHWHHKTKNTIAFDRSVNRSVETKHYNPRNVYCRRQGPGYLLN